MEPLFYELIKNYFQIHVLETQLSGFSIQSKKKEYLNFVMNEFEKKSILIWIRILGIYNKNGKVYGYDDFDMGTFEFYINNPDELSFDETTFGMNIKMNLNDFIRQCERLLKYPTPQQTKTITEHKTPQNELKQMKVSEYMPLYGLSFDFEFYSEIEGKKMTINEILENYPDFELTDAHIDQLNSFERFSLQKVLKQDYFTPETVVAYLRDLFDDYRDSGGNPYDWLQVTFESVNLNPQNYKPELRATLEKTLIEWIEIFDKLPFDYLYYKTNPLVFTPQQAVTISEQTAPKTLSELITHQKSTEIVENIKIQYKNIKGKRLKLLLIAFQALELLPKDRIAQKFYNCCKNEFKWDIASYNAMNGYNFNQRTDNDEFTGMKQHLETLIKPN